MKPIELGVGYKTRLDWTEDSIIPSSALSATQPQPTFSLFTLFLKMQTFGRLLSVLTFLLSLGFLAQALPAAPRAGLAVRQYNSPAPQSPGAGYTKPSSDNGSGVAPINGGKTVDIIASVVVEFKPKVDAHVTAIAKVETVAELDATIKALIGDIKILIAILVGGKAHLDVDARLKLAVAVHAMIIAIVKVCATIVVKLGVSACASIMAQLDVVLHSLVLAISVCVDGFLGVFVNLSINVDVAIVAALKTCGLDLVAKICAVVKVAIN
ncbi:unnamed protein product [Rhizoctonia solani]|uniref:Transmembrane protein n=1 Tax=Rhizoctonia solani TaxID=456999 RepID=A0A8H3BK26_9AGAM|nr:unnamed protein product [Rhizoctonia solani]